MTRAAEKLRTLLYLVTAVPMGAVGAAVLIAGWVACIVLAPTPLVVPALAAFRIVVSALARAEAWLARTLLGAAAQPARREPYRGGYWRRATDVLSDDDLLAGAVVSASALPARRRTRDRRAHTPRRRVSQRSPSRSTTAGATPQIGSWHVDTLGRALLFVPAGIIALMAAVVLLRPFRAAWRSLADGPPRRTATLPPSRPSGSRQTRLQALAIAAVAVAGIAVVQVIIWATTSHGYFWPAWTIARPRDRPRALRLDRVRARAASAARAPAASGAGSRSTPAQPSPSGSSSLPVWALTSHGYFWPVWPMLVLLVVVRSPTSAPW